MFLACEQIDLAESGSGSGSERGKAHELTAVVPRSVLTAVECNGTSGGPADGDDVVSFADITILPLSTEAANIDETDGAAATVHEVVFVSVEGTRMTHMKDISGKIAANRPPG